MPFKPLHQFGARLHFHTTLYLKFRERGRRQQINVQAINPIADPCFWLDDLNFGARFGPRGKLVEQKLEAGAKPAEISLPNDDHNSTGLTFVSGLSVENPGDLVWRAPLALALGMTPEGLGSGRFMVEQGTEDPIWLGHRGFLGGGGAGVIKIEDFHNRLPTLKKLLQDNPQHVGLIPGLKEAFDQVFAYNFLPDNLVLPQQHAQSVFPIAAAGTENFFQRLASYVHQCYILRTLRVKRAI